MRSLSRSTGVFLTGTLRFVTLLFVLVAQTAESQLECQTAPSSAMERSASSQSLLIGGALLKIDIEDSSPALLKAASTQHILDAAQAVAVYYGHFPVASARIVISITRGQEGSFKERPGEIEIHFPQSQSCVSVKTQLSRNSTVIGLRLTSSYIWHLLPCPIHSIGLKKG
jgi:hypothetical protein